MLIDIFIYLIAVYSVGIITFSYTGSLFKFLPDKGWGISKPIGLVAIGIVSWLVTSYEWVQFEKNLIRVIVFSFLFISISLFLIREKQIARYMINLFIFGRPLSSKIKSLQQLSIKRIFDAHKKTVRNILIVDFVFLALFLCTAVLKGFDPSITGTEKPMDFMMLNSVVSSGSNPPEDSWFSGMSVSYYYFGYWIMACMALLSGIVTSVSYNLSIALIVGISGSVMFSFVIALALRDGKKIYASLFVGFLGCYLLLLSSNLSVIWVLLDMCSCVSDTVFDWYAGTDYQHISITNNMRPTDHWWWWDSTRVINTYSPDGVGLDYTIQEFPFFSVLLGDLHPHFMGMPFILTSFVLTYSVYLNVKNSKGFLDSKILVFVALLGIFIAVIGFINYWDLAVTVCCVLLFTFGIWIRSNMRVILLVRKFLLPLLGILISSFLMFSGFYFFSSQNQIGTPPILPVLRGTRFIHFLTVWGIFLVPVVFFLSQQTYKLLKRRIWNYRYLMISGVISLSPVFLKFFLIRLFSHEFGELSGFEPFPFTILILSLMSLFSLYLFLIHMKRRSDSAVSFTFGLCFVGVYLIMIAETFYVNDMFGNRMNTVFKFYFQAWLLLSLVSAVIFSELITNINMTKKVIFTISGLIILTTIYFPIASIGSKLEPAGNFTLDGLEYLAESNPNEKQVIDYISQHKMKGEKMVESYGGSYTDNGRISSSTGVPTVLGWVFHEIQWRGSDVLVTERMGDVDMIYRTKNVDELIGLLHEYDISIIVLGPREKKIYPGFDTKIFDMIGTRIFENSEYILFRVGDFVSES
ncbi:DUF2298 domain-containing protein [Dehalococcoidia bacterium]|nr:DUF2298 domain-containing protein [Dehalococcoidia bacterium]